MKFCFVAPNIYPLLYANCEHAHIGGAELQQLYIGKGLLQQGIEIHYIIVDYDGKQTAETKDFQIHKTFRFQDGIPGLRFFYPRLIKIWNALKRADADIYYVRSAGFLLGVVAYFCHQHNRKVIYAGAHDTDFIPENHIIRFRRDILLYHYGIRHCDKLIVQSDVQKKLLFKHFGLRGEIIRNISLDPLAEIDPDNQKYILWVSTIRPWKRPERFIDLANAFPREQFVMIGGKDVLNAKLYDFIAQKCHKTQNIQFMGFQPLERVESWFDKCKLFVNTSECEGFPNTFLQAWRRGIPVLSYVDPDDVITNYGLGLAAKNGDRLENLLAGLMDSHLSQRESIKDYYLANHSSELINQYMTIIKELLG